VRFRILKNTRCCETLGLALLEDLFSPWLSLVHPRFFRHDIFLSRFDVVKYNVFLIFKLNWKISALFFSLSTSLSNFLRKSSNCCYFAYLANVSICKCCVRRNVQRWFEIRDACSAVHVLRNLIDFWKLEKFLPNYIHFWRVDYSNNVFSCLLL